MHRQNVLKVLKDNPHIHTMRVTINKNDTILECRMNRPTEEDGVHIKAHDIITLNAQKVFKYKYENIGPIYLEDIEEIKYRNQIIYRKPSDFTIKLLAESIPEWADFLNENN